MVELVDISNGGVRQSYDFTSGMRDHMAVQPPPSTMQQNSPLMVPPSNPEKNTLSELENTMASLSTPIEEVLDTPMGLMQPQVGMQQPDMIDSRTVQTHPARPAAATPPARPPGGRCPGRAPPAERAPAAALRAWPPPAAARRPRTPA